MYNSLITKFLVLILPIWGVSFLNTGEGNTHFSPCGATLMANMEEEELLKISM